MKATVENIRSTIPFTDLPDADLQLLYENSKEDTVKTETLLYHQNYTKLRYIDIILEGGYHTYFVGESLKKEQVEMMQPGEVYGPVSILFNDTLSIRSVVAMPGTRTLRIRLNAFMEIFFAGLENPTDDKPALAKAV